MRRCCFQKLWLVWTFSCIYKNGYFIMERDTFGYIDVCTIYTSNTDHFTPQHTDFEHLAACLSVVFELLPGFIPFTILWHIGWILDKNVTMNKNYSYPTTIWVSIFAQIYVFLVLCIFFAFDLETFISQNWKNILFYQKLVHLGENTYPYFSRIIAVHVYIVTTVITFIEIR